MCSSFHFQVATHFGVARLSQPILIWLHLVPRDAFVFLKLFLAATGNPAQGLPSFFGQIYGLERRKRLDTDIS
jgi:hypothetical protein